MVQINFIRNLSGEKLSLRDQFGLNLEDWNFRGPNWIFKKLIGSNQGWNCKKIKVFGVNWGLNWRNSQPMTILKKHQTLGTQLIEIRGEIEDNWKFNGQLKVNLHKFKTNDQNENDAEI